MGWRISGELLHAGLQGWFAWDNGVLTGSPEALGLLEVTIELGNSVRLSPTGPFFKADKTNELVAFIMCRNEMRYLDVTGDPPVLPWPELPEGSIA